MKTDKLLAFTLAEVLVTLGIVGVVAALTLPNLIANYQKNVYRNQFKKTYSVLQQALLAAQNEYGSKPECYYWTSGWLPHHCVEWAASGECSKYELMDGSPLPSDAGGLSGDCSAFGQVYLKSLKVVKSCPSRAYENGCIPKYKGNDTLLKESNDSLSDVDLIKKTTGNGMWRQSNILNSNAAYVLSDGQIILGAGAFNNKYFAMDINGKKGPNKWGYDVYGFKTNGERNSSIIISGSDGAGIEKGGSSATVMIQNIGK